MAVRTLSDRAGHRAPGAPDRGQQPDLRVQRHSVPFMKCLTTWQRQASCVDNDLHEGPSGGWRTLKTSDGTGCLPPGAAVPQPAVEAV